MKALAMAAHQSLTIEFGTKSEQEQALIKSL